MYRICAIASHVILLYNKKHYYVHFISRTINEDILLDPVCKCVDCKIETNDKYVDIFQSFNQQQITEMIIKNTRTVTKIDNQTKYQCIII